MINMILIIVRIIIGVMFVISGSIKMTNLIVFRDTINLFNIIPENFNNLITILIPSIELLSGIFLVLNLFKKGVISLLIPLLIIFAFAIGINVYRGESFDCVTLPPKVDPDSILVQGLD